MNTQIDSRKHLIKALCHLTVGDGRKFCDYLWLGFGDSWRPVLADLAQRQLIKVTLIGHEEHFEITPRGRAWAQQVGTLAATAA